MKDLEWHYLFTGSRFHARERKGLWGSQSIRVSVDVDNKWKQPLGDSFPLSSNRTLGMFLTVSKSEVPRCVIISGPYFISRLIKCKGHFVIYSLGLKFNKLLGISKPSKRD